jgi:hypothetical protein
MRAETLLSETFASAWLLLFVTAETTVGGHGPGASLGSDLLPPILILSLMEVSLGDASLGDASLGSNPLLASPPSGAIDLAAFFCALIFAS